MIDDSWKFTEEEEVFLQHLTQEANVGSTQLKSGISMDKLTKSIFATDVHLDIDRIRRLIEQEIIVQNNSIDISDFREFFRAHSQDLLYSSNTDPNVTDGTSSECNNISTPRLKKGTFAETTSIDSVASLLGGDELLRFKTSPLLMRIEAPIFVEDLATMLLPEDNSTNVQSGNWISSMDSIQARIDDIYHHLGKVVDGLRISSNQGDILVLKDERKQLCELLVKEMALAHALIESFRQSVMKNVRTIVDEMPLPNHLKSIKPINNSNEDTTLPKALFNLMTYSKDGFLYQPIFGIDGLDDLSEVPNIEASIAAKECLLEKIAANQWQENNFANAALDSRVTTKILDLKYTGSALPTMALKLKKKFSALVDYAGIRFVVYSSTESATKEALFTPEAKERIFSRLQDQMNIEGIHNATFVMEWKQPRTAKYLHIVADGLLPADLPRSQSHDIMTRRFRPEFVLNYPKKVPSLSAVTKTENISSSSISVWNELARYYYSSLLPSIASKLDSYDAVVFDSHSLTEYLHKEGVNMRHLGVLYLNARNVIVRQLLFGEIVARSCKHLTRGALKSWTRLCKSDSIDADYRNKSKPQDFIELAEHTKQRREEIVLEVFNHMFSQEATSPSAPLQERSAFFSLLFDIIYSKYGVLLKTESELEASPLHPPHLFQALQYHLSVRFKEESSQIVLLDRLGTSRAFSRLDVIDFFLPSARVPSPFVGEAGFLLSQRGGFFSAGLMPEADTLYELQWLLDSRLAGETRPSWPLIYAAMRSAHIFAVSQAMQGRWERTAAIVRAQLRNPFAPFQSALMGRLLTVLIAAEYKCGRFERAMQCFDSALEALQRWLPPGHPLVATPMILLGDLYLSQGKAGIAGAKVMLHMAWSLISKTSHYYPCLSTALQLKLGGLLLESESYRAAEQLLTPCCKTLEMVTETRLQDLAFCLYRLCCTHFYLEEHDLALQYGQKCLTSLERATSELWARRLLISTRLLMFDIHSVKGEAELSLENLQEAWLLLRSGKAFGQSQELVRVLLHVAIKSAELSLSSLPLQSRMLLESIAREYRTEAGNTLDDVSLSMHSKLREEPNLLDTDASSRELWKLACKAIIDIMWRGQSLSYALHLLHRIKVQHLEEQAVMATNPTLENGQKSSLDLKVSFSADKADAYVIKLVDSLPLHVQAAALIMLVHQPIQFAQLLNGVVF